MSHIQVFNIKRSISKAKSSYGLFRFSVDCGSTKVIEVGMGYDMVGALLLKFLKARFSNLKEIWDNTHNMLGCGEIQRIAHEHGVNVQFATDDKGSIVGFVV